VIPTEKFVLLSAAASIGEGYDLRRLDPLFLATSLSFTGRLVQWAGRPTESVQKIARFESMTTSIKEIGSRFRCFGAGTLPIGKWATIDQDGSGPELDLG